jgi:hypothetical protein
VHPPDSPTAASAAARADGGGAAPCGEPAAALAGAAGAALPAAVVGAAGVALGAPAAAAPAAPEAHESLALAVARRHHWQHYRQRHRFSARRGPPQQRAPDGSGAAAGAGISWLTREAARLASLAASWWRLRGGG